ncbi:MAG: DUF3667 domain-containing protein [Woeseiaceae bacterium]
MVLCKNCDTPIEANFCPQCGQKDIELERPLTALLGEVIRETFEVDGRVARTIWTLVRRPGVLTSEFLAGRRRLYSSPLRLYLVVSLLFFLLATWSAGQGMLLIQGQPGVEAVGPARIFADYAPRLMVFLLPVFALFLKVAFRKRFYFDHLIHCLHLHSVLYIVLSVILLAEHAAEDHLVTTLIQQAILIYMLASFVISVHIVYRVGWFAATANAVGLIFGYLVLVAGSLEAVARYMTSGIFN